MTKTRILLLAILVAGTVLCTACSQGVLSDQPTQPKVLMQTELGNIVLELYPLQAPLSANNFLRYVDEERYKEASFYRVVRMDNQPNNDILIEVIQGGIGFVESDLRLPSIQHETTEATGLLHKAGTISMARAEVGTADSEIFICIGNQPELDFGGQRNPDGQGFAAFGQVIEGMDVVKAIQSQADEGQMLIDPIKILAVKRLK